MSRWVRTVPFAADRSDRHIERWEYRRGASDVRAFEVDVRLGKPLDVVALKGAGLDTVRDYAAHLAVVTRRLYGHGAPLEQVVRCPCCEAPLADASVALRVRDVAYVRCARCAHVCVAAQPNAAALATLFAESDEHSAPYVDRAALDVRMAQIVTPKLDWCLEQYERCSDGVPSSVIDVGAGGGHFVAGAAARGFAAQGFEKSRASRAFAAEAFGITLRSDEFAHASMAPADLVTFWGLLEYIPQPRALIAAARRALAPNGLLIVEVPRADALGTAVQAKPGAVIARHMEPSSHLHAFSDESLLIALVEEGFEPVAAWYFGMDAWELLVQAALRQRDDALVARLADALPTLQCALDRGRQCDDIIVAARLAAR